MSEMETILVRLLRRLVDSILEEVDSDAEMEDVISVLEHIIKSAKEELEVDKRKKERGV